MGDARNTVAWRRDPVQTWQSARPMTWVEPSSRSFSAGWVSGPNTQNLPPPFSPASFTRYLRWLWLAQGAAQYLSGQVAHLRPAIARRLHEGARPKFPPGVRDAALLGGTVFDLLAHEEGTRATVDLACRPLHSDGAVAALVKAFGGREIAYTAEAWRAHLERLGA